MANNALHKRILSDKQRAVLEAHKIKKGQVLNQWGSKGRDGEITDLITKQARRIAAERVKTESGASIEILDAEIRKLAQLGLHGDVQAILAYLDLVRGHKLKADIGLSGSLEVNGGIAEAVARANGEIGQEAKK